MNLSAPKKVIFLISLVLGIFAILAAFIPALHFMGNGQAFWTAVLAWLVLAAGNLMTGV